MRILLISNQTGDEKTVGNPILQRMLRSLKKKSIVEEAHFAPFLKSSLWASLREISRQSRCHDLVHVHFGGIYALLVWFFLLGARCPKLITFHGTDIHARSIHTAKRKRDKLKIRLNQWASFLCILLYSRPGFVAEELKGYVPRLLGRKMRKKSFVQPLGVDYSLFLPIEKTEAQKALNITEKHPILFSDISNTSVKRRDLAQAIVDRLPEYYSLLIMCGVTPEKVPLYINACDCLLLTSDEEGSPNIIRECLALDKQVFSVDVGDAAKQLQGLTNSLIISRDPDTAARQIVETLEKPYTDNTRETLRPRLDFDLLNEKTLQLYQDLLG